MQCYTVRWQKNNLVRSQSIDGLVEGTRWFLSYNSPDGLVAIRVWFILTFEDYLPNLNGFCQNLVVIFYSGCKPYRSSLHSI